VYARSTTIHGKPENIDAGMRFIESEAWPTMDEIEGCLGLSCLVDRESGQAIATSAWSTQDAMRSSDDRLRPIRERGREIFGGSMQVDEWEIGVMHRAEHGEFCRVTWAQGSDMDRMLEVFKYETMPGVEELDGFCSASLLMNRDTGMVCVTTTWSTREEMQSSRQSADQLRKDAADNTGMEILEVREFELAYAHLHVPELV